MTESIACQAVRPFDRSWRALALAVALCLKLGPCGAAMPEWVPESGEIDRATARALVDTLVNDVEAQALRPRVQAEYDAAKARLVALLEAPAPTLDRHTLYGAARSMLSTLDTDGHTMLWSKQQTSTWTSFTSPKSAGQAAVAHTMPAPDGSAVLVLRPPQTTFMDTPSTRLYVEALTAQVNRTLETSPAPCALVVDLSDQAGGNAWPALAALASLLTPANTAELVDRDGQRRPLVSRGSPEYFFGGALPPSDLARFAGRPFAVILTGQTVSAGEMLAIALRGEPAVRTFGRPTGGATTGNVPTALPDGATVLLTTSRYAWGNGRPLRGPLLPDVQADTNATPAATLAQAAEWAAGACHR